MRPTVTYILLRPAETYILWRPTETYGDQQRLTCTYYGDQQRLTHKQRLTYYGDPHTNRDLHTMETNTQTETYILWRPTHKQRLT